MSEKTASKENKSASLSDVDSGVLRDFLRSAPLPYLILDESGGIVEANRAFNTLLRKQSGLLSGTPLAAIIVERSKKRYFEILRDFLAGTHKNGVSLLLLRQDGAAVPVELFRQTELGTAKGVRQFIIAVCERQDEQQIEQRVAQHVKRIERSANERIRALENELEARKQMDVATREGQERQALAFWGARVAWFEYDVSTDKILFSPRIGDVLGSSYSTAPITSEEFFGYIFPEDADMARQTFNDHLAGATPIVDVQLRMASDDGQWKWVSIRGRITVTDNDQKPLRMIGIAQDISEMKRVEEERALFFRHSQDLLAVLDRDGRFRQVNPAWQRVLGWKPEQMIGQPAISFTHPEDRDKGQQTLNALHKGEPPPLLEQRALCKDGGHRWLSCILVPLHDYDMSIGVARDITDQKEKDLQLRELNQTLEQRVLERSAALQKTLDEYRRTADELRRQKAYLSEAMAIGRIAYWEYDLETEAFIVNDAFYDMMRTSVQQEGGYRVKATVMQERFLTGAHPGPLVACMARIPDVDSKALQFFELPMLFGDGTVGYAMLRICHERDAQQNIIRVYGIVQDITKLKSIKQELEDQERMYRGLFEAAPAPIFIADAQTGMLVDANEQAQRFVGRSLDALRGMRYTELHDDETRGAAVKTFGSVYKSGVPESVVVRLLHHKDGYRLVNIIARAVACDKKVYLIGIMTDTTASNGEMELLLRQKETGNK